MNESVECTERIEFVQRRMDEERILMLIIMFFTGSGNGPVKSGVKRKAKENTSNRSLGGSLGENGSQSEAIRTGTSQTKGSSVIGNTLTASSPPPGLMENGSSGSGASESKKRKKARTTFTGRQIFELERQFEVKKYLSSSERAEMARLLNVTETQVSRKWCQLPFLSQTLAFTSIVIMFPGQSFFPPLIYDFHTPKLRPLKSNKEQ